VGLIDVADPESSSPDIVTQEIILLQSLVDLLRNENNKPATRYLIESWFRKSHSQQFVRGELKLSGEAR
jgi:hypothetical protein